MNITKVFVSKVENKGNMKAVAEIVIDDCFVVHEIKVIEANGRLFIGMPAKKRTNGTFKDIAHPINAEVREKIQSAILEAYNNLKED